MQKKAFLFIGISFEVAGLLWLFVVIGEKLDHHYRTGYSFTFILVILALLLWFYQLVYLFKRKKKVLKKEKSL